MKMTSKIMGIIAIASIALIANTTHAGAENNKKANSGWDKSFSVELTPCEGPTMTLDGKVHFVWKKALGTDGFALNYNTVRVKSPVIGGQYYVMHASGQISGTQFNEESPPVIVPGMSGTYLIKNDVDESAEGPYKVTFDLKVEPDEGKKLKIEFVNVDGCPPTDPV